MKKATKTMKKSTGNTTSEPVWYGEVATYRHENPGKVTFETVSTANEDVMPSHDSERITRLGKVRVETRVTEWKGTDENGKVYQKDVETVQLSDSDAPTSTSTSGEPVNTAADAAPENGEPTPLKVLKNFVDNIAADVREHKTLMTILVIGALLIGTAALILAIV